VGNAKPLLTTEDGTDPLTGVSPADISSVIEIDPLTGAIVFSNNSVDFSLLTLGSAIEVNEQYIAVAGIIAGEGPPEPVSETTTTARVGGGIIQTTKTKTAAQSAPADEGTTTTATSDVDVLAERRGVVKIVERRSSRVVFEQETSDGTYPADIQIDGDGHLVTIEKSFDGGAVQGRVVKLDEDGNVFFQFGAVELAAPNDVRVLSTGNLVIST
jgi:hypothetical protein